MTLTRRHVIAGAAATVAAAALPAVVAAEQVTYLDPAELAWSPCRSYVSRQLISIGDQLYVVLVPHISDETPSDRYLSRPLRVSDDGRLVEESA